MVYTIPRSKLLDLKEKMIHYYGCEFDAKYCSECKNYLKKKAVYEWLPISVIGEYV